MGNWNSILPLHVSIISSAIQCNLPKQLTPGRFYIVIHKFNIGRRGKYKREAITDLGEHKSYERQLLLVSIYYKVFVTSSTLNQIQKVVKNRHFNVGKFKVCNKNKNNCRPFIKKIISCFDFSAISFVKQ